LDRSGIHPTCNRTGYTVVMQPVQPGRKIFPVKCKVCDDKGKIIDVKKRMTGGCRIGINWG
jgi:hypothetical protein